MIGKPSSQSLFSCLPLSEWNALVSKAEILRFSPGQTIFSMGDPGDSLFVVDSGEVEISVRDTLGEEIVFDVLKKGEVFGELAVLDHGARTATARAVSSVEVLAIKRAVVREFLVAHPDLGYLMMEVLAARLRNADTILRRRAARNANEQIGLALRWDQKLANFIAEYSGTMSFLFINAIFFFLWIIMNLDWVPGVDPFDPFPFGLLTMAVSLEAIFLSIFVLLAQNVQSAKDRIRGDIEYEVNLKAELEVAELHQKLEIINENVLERLSRIEKLVKQG